MLFDYEETEEVDIEEKPTIFREFEIDDNGCMTGRILEGSEALKIWARNALLTPRYRFEICTWNYGSELEDLIGKTYSKEYTESRARKSIEDCLKANQFINGISGFTLTVSGESMHIEFKMLTAFGDEEVSIDV